MCDACQPADMSWLEDYRKDVVRVNRCSHCWYYGGVHGVPGKGPCYFWKIKEVRYDDYCSRGGDDGVWELAQLY